MKKIYLLITFCLVLFSCSFKVKPIIFLGSDLYKISYIEELKKNEVVNDDYLMKDGYISFLYSFIVEDAKMNSSSIKKDIKNASKIFINIGNKDMLRCIKYEGNEFVCDDNVLSNQKELFSYYYYHIIEEIRELSSKPIYMFSPYNLYEDDKKNAYEKVMNGFYDVYEEVASYFSCILIDIRNVSLLNEEQANNYIDKVVKYGT